MASNIDSSLCSVGASTGTEDENHFFSLTVLTSLFFMWGFITCLNDILIPHLKSVFTLSYTQAMLVQFCFFGAYFIVSIPAGRLIRAIGYKNGIITGLLIAGVGCLVFYPAAHVQSYPVFLLALFVLASGITVLQVAANPYVTILGKEQTASSRLNLTQAFNSLGTTVAPYFGAMLILGAATSTVEISAMNAVELEAYRASEAAAVQVPYLFLAATLFVIAAVFAALKLPVITSGPEKAWDGQPSVLTHRHLTLGALGIFVYVGAEVSIGSFLVSFLAEETIANLEEAEAGKYIAYYWGGAMVGRFIGAAMMQRVQAGVLLCCNALASVLLIIGAMTFSGSVAMWSILLVGLCNSIMFPTIFSLALGKLGEQTSQGAGVLCLAIVGGAIIPLFQGILADKIGVQMAFVLPLVCYLYIAYYGLMGSQPK